LNSRRSDRPLSVVSYSQASKSVTLLHREAGEEIASDRKSQNRRNRFLATQRHLWRHGKREKEGRKEKEQGEG